MLESDCIDNDEKPHALYSELRGNSDLPLAMQFWTARVARDLLQFGVFLQAATIMLQVLGGAGSEFVVNEDEEDDIAKRVRGEHGRTLLDVFADCVKRLHASPEILKQLPGGEGYERRELSKEWTAFLDAQEEVEHGLQNVVAEILDKLIVRPKLNEIDAAPVPTWWQEWWNRIGDTE